jgi:Ca2+-binding RTX toxin-like protein
VQFWALNGTATVSLGTGSDTLQLNQLFGNDIGHATIVVSDFATGAAGDRLDWIGFLANGLRNWDQNTNPFKSGHLRLLQSGTDTLLQIDRDGGGAAYAFTTLIKFENVAATALTAFNLGGYAAGRIGYPGTEGADALNGTAADDLLLALGGDDRLDGLGGADRMEGGPGNDIFIVDNVGDRAIEQAGEGRDRVLSSVRFTLAANVEDLELTGFAAIAGTGNSAANTIKGNSAANLLRGLGGNDVLEGRGGADSLFGGSGKDVLVGGAGADGFYFDTAPNAVSNVDKILDFSGADDTIYLDRDIFTGIAADGPLAAAAFRLGTTAVDADDRVLYDQATGNIRYDPDGAGGAAAILFAQITPGTTLTSADFVGCI